MEYIKDSNTLIANLLNLRIVQSLPASARDEEILLVENHGFYQYHNNAFVELCNFAGSSPDFIGEIRADVTNLDDNKWLLCDGSSYSTVNYPALYDFLGSNFLPDLRECHLVGIGTNDTDTIEDHYSFSNPGELQHETLQEHYHATSSSNHTHNVTWGDAHSHNNIQTTSNALSAKECNGYSQAYSYQIYAPYDVGGTTSSANYSYYTNNSNWTTAPAILAGSMALKLKTPSYGVNYYIRAKL